MSHYNAGLTDFDSLKADLIAKGVDISVMGKQTPNADGNTPVDESVYKCIFCRDVDGTPTQYFEKISDGTLWKATGYDSSTLATSDLDAEAIDTLDATFE